MVQVKIINKSTNKLPSYQTDGASGLDIIANLEAPVTLNPLERILVKTGLYIEIPLGYEGQIRPRSGLALKNGISVLNSPGTIDSDYRGEIGVILINLSNESFVINHGDRIAQLIFSKYEKVSFSEVSILEETDRGIGGFGHTGKN